MEEVFSYSTKLEAATKKVAQDMQKQNEDLARRKKAFEDEKISMAQKYKVEDNLIELNVGGTFYTTFKATLCKHEHTFLEAMFSGRHPQKKDSQGRFFIDRSGDTFKYILHFLRTDELVYPDSRAERKIFESDLIYYGLNKFTPDLFDDSEILNAEQMEKLSTFCGSKEKEWKLLYRGSRDGLIPANFRSKCSGKAPTLTVAVSNTGCIMGGYNSRAWAARTNGGGYASVPDAWLFSFLNGEAFKFIPRHLGNEIYDEPNSFPIFGQGNDFNITPNLQGTSNLSSFACLSQEFRHSSIAMQNQFKIKDIEVFQLV